ncbi:hypothetical protein V8G54_009694 [Vigna mungo]|uniref:Uncharacterized protein n=1 Tax=Vigna mungo TaxID=3915 RepID=A0AAQ3S453_VIGMU
MMVEMRKMMQRLEANMKVIHRIGRAQAAMMRHAFGASHLDFMTPAEYDAFVAWPGDQAPTTGGGATSSRAQAMEEDGTEECDSDAGTEIIEEDDDDDSEENGTEVEDVDGDEDDEDDD